MRRFIIKSEEINQPEVLLSEAESRHALSVLRLRVGAHVTLIDGCGHEAGGIFGEIRSGRVLVITGGASAKKISDKYHITLVLSVIKPERMEWAIEKACELGVHAIVPVLAERSVVKLSAERWNIKIERWKKIAAETCKQCGLSRVPDISPVRPLKGFLKDLTGADVMLIPTLTVPGRTLVSILSKNSAAVPRLIAWIGPEGDFTKKETEMIQAAGAEAVTLGSLTLRSETAALYLLSAVKFFYET